LNNESQIQIFLNNIDIKIYRQRNTSDRLHAGIYCVVNMSILCGNITKL